MFDIELYEISEKAFNSMNHEERKKRNLKKEKKALEIIKAYAYTIDENGIARIRISLQDNPYEYYIFKSIIDSGRLKYFEDEYSLYFLGEERLEIYSDVRNIITFIWNSLEYNIRNMPKAKSK